MAHIKRRKSKNWSKCRDYDRTSKATAREEQGELVSMEIDSGVPNGRGGRMTIGEAINWREWNTAMIHRMYGKPLIDTSDWSNDEFRAVWRPGSNSRSAELAEMEAAGYIEIDAEAVRAFNKDGVIPPMFRLRNPPGYVKLGIDVSLIAPRRAVRHELRKIQYAAVGVIWRGLLTSPIAYMREMAVDLVERHRLFTLLHYTD